MREGSTFGTKARDKGQMHFGRRLYERDTHLGQRLHEGHIHLEHIHLEHIHLQHIHLERIHNRDIC